MPATSNYKNLRMIQPAFDSPVTDLILKLDYLKKRPLGGSTHPGIFFQLKTIFHTLESIGSARIEGNNTTLAEYIESKIEPPTIIPPGIQEILNMENAMRFIDDIVKDRKIDRAFVSELHKMVVLNLAPPPSGEGDRTPGLFRSVPVRLNQSAHIPPDHLFMNDYMEELYAFINQELPEKYDLLKVAISHHRFAWIHPFTNGNGRSVRLLTYAMLVKMGFRVDVGHIINPTAVFCFNRDEYYRNLSIADTGEEKGLLTWCTYVLSGLKSEIEKIDRLLDYQYLSEHILLPAIQYSLERKFINELEAKILKVCIQNQILQAGHLKSIFPQKKAAEVSRQIRRLIGKKMLQPIEEKKRKYILRFDNNYLLRGIIDCLKKLGFCQ
jgi:Fic family protein